MMLLLVFVESATNSAPTLHVQCLPIGSLRNSTDRLTAYLYTLVIILQPASLCQLHTEESCRWALTCSNTPCM